MGTSVIAHSDAPPVFKLGKHVLNLMTLFVEVGVVGDESATIFLRGYARRYTFGFQGSSEPVGVITPISNHLFGCGQKVE